MFGFSSGELLLIASIALILFGNEKLPENIKKFINSWKKAKKATQEIQNSWLEIQSEVQNLVQKNEAIPIPKAPINIVSQDEIDSHQKHFENTEEITTKTQLNSDSSYNASNSEKLTHSPSPLL